MTLAAPACELSVLITDARRIDDCPEPGKPRRAKKAGIPSLSGKDYY